MLGQWESTTGERTVPMQQIVRVKELRVATSGELAGLTIPDGHSKAGASSQIVLLVRR